MRRMPPPVANASSPAWPASSSISNASCSGCTRNLPSKTYRPGPYRTFTIYEGKTRQISAAPFRDRVVHHALTGVLEPIFERSFIFDSYACRKGKGTKFSVPCRVASVTLGPMQSPGPAGLGGSPDSNAPPGPSHRR